MAEGPASAPMAVEPDPDFVEAEEPLENLPQVSLDIFNVVKTSHAQHGLRHGDYLRYRQYCARRLHRIRKAAGLTHGKGRFAKKPLEPRMIREGKHLMLALYCSERAWSYAMQLKRENTASESRPKYHALHRLRKAAKWSTALQELCQVRSDKRTALEADAYCGFMHGNLHLEREEWGTALQQLKRTRTICSELSKVSHPEQVSTCRARGGDGTASGAHCCPPPPRPPRPCGDALSGGSQKREGGEPGGARGAARRVPPGGARGGADGWGRAA